MAQVIAVPAAHDFLRRATKRLHHRIDQTSILAALTLPEVTLSVYRMAMQSLERAYAEIDRLLLERVDLCPATLSVYTARVPSIECDLLALGVRRDAPRTAQPRSGLRMPDSEAAYLGMRYVVEGAQLGSRVIYGYLYAVFGEKLREFGSFWTPGSVLQSSWPGVLKSLAGLESRESLAAAAHAARQTFRHMELNLAMNKMEAW